jgi:hypothetical protein
VGGTGLASGTTLSAQRSNGQGARKGRSSGGTHLAVTLGGLARVVLKAGWAGLKQNGLFYFFLSLFLVFLSLFYFYGFISNLNSFQIPISQSRVQQ